MPRGMTDTGPILFFDSGVGGLSIAAPARHALPGAPFVYAADTAGFPYGTRGEAEIAGRVPALLGRLVERYRPSIVVIACNTASTIALPAVRAALDLPVVGTVPAIRPAALASVTRVIGVLGTPATVRQAYVDDLVARFAADCTVVRFGSARLVQLAEAKLRGETDLGDAVRDAVAPLIVDPDAARMDTVVLACTHFPLLADELQAAIPQPVMFTDGGAGIARRIAHLARDMTWASPRIPDRAVFTRLGDAEALLAPAFATRGFDILEAL